MPLTPSLPWIVSIFGIEVSDIGIARMDPGRVTYALRDKVTVALGIHMIFTVDDKINATF
jgi:hypothetical protein